MRPKKNMPTNAVDLFRSRLDQIINLKHELALLAGKIDWVWLDEQIAPLYSETGRPAVETRFMLGLLLLKHMFGLSDDEICERWVETPGAHAILVLDGAGWHTSHTLDPPHNVTLLCLPPYSPELNPVENVWE